MSDLMTRAPQAGDVLRPAQLDRLPEGSAIVLQPVDGARQTRAPGALLRMPEGWRSHDDDGEVRPPEYADSLFLVLFVGNGDLPRLCRCAHPVRDHNGYGRCPRAGCGCTAARG